MVGLNAGDSRGSVLVVEDDDATRDAIRALIERDGHVVATAADGDEALRMLRGGLRPCIIVLDLALKTCSGFTFREAQLKDPQLADIPIIIESGVYDVKLAAAQLRAVAYFRKPFDAVAMLDSIREYCASQ